MIAAEIKSNLLTHILYQLHFTAAVTEYGGKGVYGIADLFGVTKAGYTHEFEVKISKQDLAGELNAIKGILKPDDLMSDPKEKRKHASKSPKHNVYLGKSNSFGYDPFHQRPNYFSFVTPFELQKFALEILEETPYGLFCVDVHENGGYPYSTIGCQKRASYLHKEKPNQGVADNILRKACTEVEALRREVLKKRYCTKCLCNLPGRCDGCEEEIKRNRIYRKASNYCMEKGFISSEEFKRCVDEQMTLKI